MKRRQKRDRDFFGQLFFVTSGTLAPFALIPVGEYIEIMVADPASNDDFMYIMIEYYRALTMPAEFLAFKFHNPCIGQLILGPGR